MKQIGYIGIVLLAGLAIALWPRGGSTAQAATGGSSGDTVFVFGTDAPPFIAPTPIQLVPKTAFVGEGGNHQAALYVVNFIASNWTYYTDSRRAEIRPDDVYGLDMFLMNSKTGKRIDFLISGYVPGTFGPQGDRLMIKYSPWLSNQIGTYDLIMRAPGISTTLKGALEVLQAPVVGGDDTVETPTPPTPERPVVEIQQDSTSSPTISDYDVAGSTITLTGTNWPNQQSGLTVSLREHNTDNFYRATLVSYVPLAGRAVFQTEYLPTKDYTAYDIIVATINGDRTVISNGLWFTSSS